jgi:hypothetical protein
MTERVRRLAGWTTGVLLWHAAGAGLLACPICFQMEQGPVTDGVRAAVLVLMAVTCTVLAGFAAFIVRFTGRRPLSRAFARPRSVPEAAGSVQNRHDPHVA